MVASCIERMQSKPDLDRETPKEWTVYLPLEGIAGISENSLKIGRVHLQYMNDAEMDVLCSKVDKILSGVLAPPGDKGPEDRYKFLRDRTQTLKNTFCAIHHIKTPEPERAKEIAEKKTQDVLDLLSYFISFKHSRDYRGAVRLQGEMARALRTTLLLTPDADRFYQANQVKGAYMPIEFTAEDIERMKELGIFDVAAILERGRPKKFRKTVIDGIRWFATSQRQETPEMEFVNLVKCLENCLTPDDRLSSISASIAEGCAILLEDDLEPRLQTRKAVVDIYGIRSKIVHSGRSISSKSEKKQLENLRRIARDLLSVLIKRIDDFETKKELERWLTEQKLRFSED